MDSPGMFPGGFCQKHSLLAGLMPCTACPMPISHSSATRQPSRLSAKAQRPPSGLPSVFPEAKLVSIKPGALDQLPVPDCQEELPLTAPRSSVSLSSNYLATRVLTAQNTLLEEQRAIQYIGSLSDPSLATHLGDLSLWSWTNTPSHIPRSY